MTLLFEKCNFEKSPQVDDAVKLMAFADWAQTRPVASVMLFTANRELAECLHRWCVERNARFDWRPVRGAPALSRLRLQRVYDALPTVLRAMVWLTHHAVRRWPLRGKGVQAWQRSSGGLCFFSYLFNLIPVAVVQGRYESRYWDSLPTILDAAHCRTNWLHLYIEDPLLPNARAAANAVGRFDRAASGGQVHATLDSFLGVGVLFDTLRDWISIAFKAQALERWLAATTVDGLILWPLFRAEWQETTAGAIAVGSLLYHNQLRTALAALPKQRMGVYLQENQAWEFGLLQAWRAAGHGRLVGCPHSTVRYWDLRYFFDAREYGRAQKDSMPMPDCVAVNGVAAHQAYLAGGYPTDELVQVEALRYLHLAGARRARQPRAAGARLRLAVFNDYAPRHTRTQMALLEKAAKSLEAGLEIVVKPHPACPVAAADYPGLSMTLTDEPIDKLLGDCDAAFVSAVTSAAIDAYCAAVPVIVALDPAALNLSPLRGRSDVSFVSTAGELAGALRSAADLPPILSERPMPFHLDPSLPRWRKMLLE